MEKLLEVLNLDSKEALQVLIAEGLAEGANALEAKLGVSLPKEIPNNIAEIVVRIFESSQVLKQAKAAGANAAAEVKTPEQADTLIGTTPGGGIVTGLFAALVLACSLVSLPVMAQPADAPTSDEVTALAPLPVVKTAPATEDRSAELVPLTTGQPAPFDGRLYSNKLHVDVAKRIVNCETTLKQVEPKVGMPAWQVALIALGSAVVAASITASVTVAVTKPK